MVAAVPALIAAGEISAAGTIVALLLGLPSLVKIHLGKLL